MTPPAAPSPPPPSAARWAWRALFAALVLVVAWLAFTPRPPAPAETLWDKANHALAFAALAACAAGGWPGRARRIALGLLVYGLLIEAVQQVIPERSADLADVVGDAVGIAAGLVLAAAGAAARRKTLRRDRLTP